MAEAEATIVIRARDEASQTVQRFGGQINNLNKLLTINVRSLISTSAVLSAFGLSTYQLISKIGKYVTETRAASVATGQLRNLFLLTGLSTEQVNSSLDILRKTFDKTTYAALPQNIEKFQDWLELSDVTQRQIADWSVTLSAAYGVDKTALIEALSDAFNGNYDAIEKLLPQLGKLTGTEGIGKLSTEYDRIKKELGAKPSLWDLLLIPGVNVELNKTSLNQWAQDIEDAVARANKAMYEGKVPPVVLPLPTTTPTPSGGGGGQTEEEKAAYEAWRKKQIEDALLGPPEKPTYQPTIEDFMRETGMPTEDWEAKARAAGLVFQKGGTVPGPIGEPQVAMVHGGETITPSGQGMTIVIPVSIGGQRLETIVLEVLNGTVRRRMSEIA